MICQRTGCTREATHAPKICVPAVSGRVAGRQVADAVLTLVACAECMTTLAAADFVAPGEVGRDTLRAALAYRFGEGFWPDFGDAWLEWLPLTSPEWLEVERLRAGRAH